MIGYGQDSGVRKTILHAALLLLLVAPVVAQEANGQKGADGAVARFCAALSQQKPDLLASILPGRGKVQLRLIRLGPEAGFFSAEQVRTLLAGAIRRTPVREFTVVGIQQEEDSFALAHVVATLETGSSEGATIHLYLSFRAEQQRWTLREIRETQP